MSENSSVIKINAITVPEGSGDELGKRFAQRQGSMDGTPGFQGYELLQPTDGRNVWLVVTRWDSEEDFENWRDSQHFDRAHGDAERADDGGGAARREEAGHGEKAPNEDEAAGEQPQQKPVGASAELWSYTVSVTG